MKIKKKIGIIDLGSHNLFSIFQAVKNLKHYVKIINKSEQINKFDIIILPGVGTFGNAMKILNSLGMAKELKKFSKNSNKKIIGICLGMQLLLSEGTEFGKHKGLGIIEGSVIKLDKVKLNIGWKQLKINEYKSYNFLNKDLQKNYFYFVHSFYCSPKDKNIIKAKFEINDTLYCGMFIKDNIIGLQFHPEKSGKAGLIILKNILK
tara:strand:- start:71 stop:688 length:618 start_codon:yes stop_codon:yes gene_type:complete